jgi:hypothetical protein
MSVRVFLSYAHEDRAWCERLLDHLGSLRHSGQLAVFDDQQIKPGEHWDERIRGELADASIVVPLISPSFIGSRYCSVDELTGALQAGKRLIPVLIDHVDLAALPVAAMQCLPKDERQDLKALVDWPNPNQALAMIAVAIRQAMAESDTNVLPPAAPTGRQATIPQKPQSPLVNRRALPTPWFIGAIALAALVAVAAIGLLASGGTKVSATGGVAGGRDANGNIVINNGTTP